MTKSPAEAGLFEWSVVHSDVESADKIDTRFNTSALP